MEESSEQKDPDSVVDSNATPTDETQRSDTNDAEDEPKISVETNDETVDDSSFPGNESATATETEATKEEVTNAMESLNENDGESKVEHDQTSTNDDSLTPLEIVERDVSVDPNVPSQTNELSSKQNDNDISSSGEQESGTEKILVQEAETENDTGIAQQVSADQKNDGVTETKEESSASTDEVEAGVAETKEGETNVDETRAESVNNVSSGESTTGTSTPAKPSESGQPSALGAQILMNRFSTWKKTANERLQTANEKLTTRAPVLQENAKQASEYAQRVFQSNSLSSLGLGSRFASQKPKAANNSETATTKTKNTDAEAKPVEDKEATDKTDMPESQGEAKTLPEADSPKLVSSGSLLDDDDDDDSDTDDENDAESATVKETTKTVTEQAERARAIFSKASESVATSFRGRYTLDVAKTVMSKGNTASGSSSNLSNDDDATNDQQQESSQMALILKSRAGEYMQEILDQLEPYEFAMLLGRGMLGVNLKQCYLKNHGIFVDYLVDGGQAAQSGLVRSGDLMVRLADSDFRKGTIKDVPLEIAKAKRPSVLVLATGTQVTLERVNFVDVAVAMMHRARRYYEERGSFSILPSARTRSNSTNTSNGESSSPPAPSTEKEEKNGDLEAPKSVCDTTINTHDTVEAYTSPPWPTLAVRKEFVDETSLRCLDNFVVSDLCEVLDMDSNFRAAIRNAFLVCALDSRRLPFLARHFSNEEQQLTSNNFGSQEEKTNMTPSAQLMLFLELASFLDLYDLTPSSRLKDVASRIAYKFFLPTKIGNGIQPPLFDFHQIVPYSSLRHLEFALSGNSQSIPRDIFMDFQKSIVDSLSGAPFLSFLASTDCSRMRAYLRDTAPFVHLPFKQMMNAMAKGTESAIDTAAAHNSFAYILLYLLCRMEKECSGEYDFLIENEQNRRLLGATHDVCCALFIQRTLLPTLTSASKEGNTLSESSSQKVLAAVEQLWNLYLADSLELSTRNAEIEGIYEKVRKILLEVSTESYESSSNWLPSTCAASILKSTLAEEAAVLADEILFDYSANINSKFRDHKFHEWICSEFTKVLASDPYWYKTHPVPVLPQGCLKRLLRKVELPSSVSSHKPYQVTPKEETNRSYHNADWAVVFGSSVGTNLASQMAVPGLDSSDIRRYTCLPVALDRDYIDHDEFQPEHVLPATFESYAFVPPSKPKPFQSVVDAGRVTVDGWEISLVSFSIPNADSSSSGDSTESALYGVSLCFQRVGSSGNGQKSIATKLVVEDETSDENDSNWNSPISFEKSSGEESEEFIRKVKVASKLPVFEQHLHERTWVKRVEDEEYRDQSSPISIGIALVSRRNVIFAMRDSLSRLFFDYSRQPGKSLEDTKASTTCGALVELLGACSYQDHEGHALRRLLEPYLRVASAPWIDRPLSEQETMFESHALRQLTDSLPPTSLALLFVTALLEQKIIFSSSRRSVLHAASVGLATLLRPLKWSHLLVPMVPGALANDLIQYPAPFIFGVPSEEADSIDLLGNLPRDVTLVDLDVGRVILAPDFGRNNEMCRGTADVEATARALRSQVLYLAQGLGTVFGNSLRSESWISDEPSLYGPTAGKIHNDGMSVTARLDQLRSVVKSFIDELLEGSVSCCYWIEEMAPTYGSTSEPTVLFDEDKFFEIKSQRGNRSSKPLFPRNESKSGELALILDDFDLVLESFLRCQSMSIYISSRPKKDMFYY